MWLFARHEYFHVTLYDLSSDDGRLELDVHKKSCLVKAKSAKASDHGKWSFFTGIGKDHGRLDNVETTYTVVVKGKYCYNIA